MSEQPQAQQPQQGIPLDGDAVIRDLSLQLADALATNSKLAVANRQLTAALQHATQDASADTAPSDGAAG